SRQQKLELATSPSDPLSQLMVEDETSKGGKRKKKTETGRISMEVPVREGPSLVAAGGEVAELVQSPSK
ncbi:hypothetical protein A2U01_0086164, partial [Trifolium medium]|nr:hypothetical protein [Trifolium medium]